MPLDAEIMEAMYGGMTEAALLEAIRRAASLQGWLVYHTHDSRRSEPGFPDIVLVQPAEMQTVQTYGGPVQIVGIPGRVLFRELKTQKGKVTPEQARWLDALQRAGADVKVWRPFDWGGGMIEEELR